MTLAGGWNCTLSELTMEGGHTRFADILGDVRSLCDDFSVPMVAIARGMEDDIRKRLLAGVPPPLAESTIERWGNHPTLVNTGKMLDSIHHVSDKMSAAAGSTHRAAVFIEITGRAAGGAAARTRERRRKDKGFIGPGKGVRRAGRTAVVGKYKVPLYPEGYIGPGWIRWGAMPIREFSVISTERHAWAAETILDYLFAKFNE